MRFRTCDPDVVELRRPLGLLSCERPDGQLELLPVEGVFQRQLLQRKQDHQVYLKRPVRVNRLTETALMEETEGV